ncbi:MAG: polyprenyl synthetase family protein [Spirochaetaceae bacterium]|nr:polyprenyl synthetase family protein [Spirochaetaceae bacterium]
MSASTIEPTEFPSESTAESPLVRRLLARIERAVTTPLAPEGLALDGAAALAAEIEAPGRDLLALGGKRWRPLLLALTCRMCGGPEDAAIALAPVVELAHNGSLIIDDIEDGADLRRGAPAAHLRHGLDLAINAGNLLYFLPAGYLAAAGLDTAVELQVHRRYGKAMLRLHYGQGLDILWHREPDRIPAIPEYFTMCRAKSGSLAGLAAALGAAAARAPAAVTALLGEAGEEFGVCFQIVDDVRNLTTGNPGKRRGDDLVEGKKSLPVILYCNRGDDARRRMVELLAACSAAGSVAAAGEAVEEAIALMAGAGVIEEARNMARQRYREVVGRLQAHPGLAAGDGWQALRDLTSTLIG